MKAIIRRTEIFCRLLQFTARSFDGIPCLPADRQAYGQFRHSLAVKLCRHLPKNF